MLEKYEGYRTGDWGAGFWHIEFMVSRTANSADPIPVTARVGKETKQDLGNLYVVDASDLYMKAIDPPHRGRFSRSCHWGDPCKTHEEAQAGRCKACVRFKGSSKKYMVDKIRAEH